MGILSSIFGSGNVISEGFKLIDSMHTSDKEEIEAKSKAKVDLMGATQHLSKSVVDWHC